MYGFYLFMYLFICVGAQYKFLLSAAGLGKRARGKRRAERCGAATGAFRPRGRGSREERQLWRGEEGGGGWKREVGGKKFVLVIISVAEESNEGRQVMNHLEVPF